MVHQNTTLTTLNTSRMKIGFMARFELDLGLR